MDYSQPITGQNQGLLNLLWIQQRLKSRAFQCRQHREKAPLMSLHPPPKEAGPTCPPLSLMPCHQGKVLVLLGEWALHLARLWELSFPLPDPGTHSPWSTCIRYRTSHTVVTVTGVWESPVPQWNLQFPTPECPHYTDNRQLFAT